MKPRSLCTRTPQLPVQAANPVEAQRSESAQRQAQARALAERVRRRAERARRVAEEQARSQVQQLEGATAEESQAARAAARVVTQVSVRGRALILGACHGGGTRSDGDAFLGARKMMVGACPWKRHAV